MERRKANNSYVKLISKDSQAGNLRRSHSMRSSFRALKSKLNSPAIQSPFKFNTHLTIRKHHLDALKASKMLEQLDELAILKTPIKNSKKCSTHHQQLNEEAEIEQLMSALPVGSVPRKACKILQIPETYCLKYLNEQKQQADNQQKQLLHDDMQQKRLKENKSPLKENHCDYNKDLIHNQGMIMDGLEVIKNITKNASDGIYGTTRMRTATIRKPMPYMKSSRFHFFVFILNIVLEN